MEKPRIVQLRIRIGVKSLMIGVACAGILLGYGARWYRYKKMGKHHSGIYFLITIELPMDDRETPADGVALFHLRKWKEYDHAALFPWIEVKEESPPTSGSFRLGHWEPTPPEGP